MKKETKDKVIRVTDSENTILEGIRKLTSITIGTDRKSLKKDVKPSGELFVILPDPHYPFQNQGLMEKVFKCISDNEVAGVVISGDWLDLYTLGSYNADSLGLLRNISLDEEYESGLQGLKELEKVLPEDAKRMFLYGNHEDRYFREVNKRDNAKYGSTLQHPTKALQLQELGYEVKTNWKDDFFTVGDIDVMHGTYFNLHAAKKHLDMHERSCIMGHTHRIASFITGHEASFNIGTLCDLDSPAFRYMHRMQRSQWCNGFAFVTVVDGKSHFEQIIVRGNGTFVFRGVVY